MKVVTGGNGTCLGVKITWFCICTNLSVVFSGIFLPLMLTFEVHRDLLSLDGVSRNAESESFCLIILIIVMACVFTIVALHVFCRAFLPWMAFFATATEHLSYLGLSQHLSLIANLCEVVEGHYVLFCIFSTLLPPLIEPSSFIDKIYPDLEKQTSQGPSCTFCIPRLSHSSMLAPLLLPLLNSIGTC